MLDNVMKQDKVKQYEKYQFLAKNLCLSVYNESTLN